MQQDKTVDDVKIFWEKNPLFTGESEFEPGSHAFFEHHRRVVINDCFAGELPDHLFPGPETSDKVLDLGCGPGMWSIEMQRRGAKHMTSADLTAQAVELVQRRAKIYGLEVEASQQNAEALTFEDGRFSHVNCQRVIHHTPDTKACVREIARVLRPGGTAMISVYYRNVFISLWPVLRYVGLLLGKLGGGLKGRGREQIMQNSSVDEIVRLYDGAENPIGKSYSKQQYIDLLSPHFEIEELFYHFFPARALPFPIPSALHKFLDQKAGFMIYTRLKKPDAVKD